LSQHRTLPIRSPRQDIARAAARNDLFTDLCRLTIPLDEEVRRGPARNLSLGFMSIASRTCGLYFEGGLARGWLFMS
jgi:hypothetical protein